MSPPYRAVKFEREFSFWMVTFMYSYLSFAVFLFPCPAQGLLLISFAWFISSLWLVPILGWHHFFNAGDRTVAPDTCETEYATNTTLKVTWRARAHIIRRLYYAFILFEITFQTKSSFFLWIRFTIVLNYRNKWMGKAGWGWGLGRVGEGPRAYCLSQKRLLFLLDCYHITSLF